jgi:CubicO group peptidase (beta-lactamase class C family)
VPGRSLAVAVLVAAVVVTTTACSDQASPPSSSVTAAPAAGAAEAGDGGVTQAQVDNAVAKIDDVVGTEMKATGVPGVAVGVVFGDKAVFEKGYGVRELGKPEPVGKDTVFQIASLSKPVSSTAMAALVGKKRFGWDDPVAKYLPDLAFGNPYVTQNVTFADLYSHRSGLPGATGNWLEEIGFSRAEILARLRYVPLGPFRDTYSYSNFGMTAAGEAAARAAGTSFEDVMQNDLFGPAGMTTTSVRSADFAARPDHAALHVRNGTAWKVGDGRNPDAQAPAGGVSSTVGDLSRWVRLQLDGGKLDGTPIVDTAALAETHTPHVLRMPPADATAMGGFYGLGWNIDRDHLGYTRWSHSGAFSAGAATTAVLLPKAGLGVVVLTNGSPIGAAEAIADEIVDDIVKGAPTQDWSKVWGDRFAKLFVADPQYSAPPVNAAPARAAAAYTGSCSNPYYGTYTVTADPSGQLTITEGPALKAFPMTHWSGDTFTIVDAPTELPDIRIPLTFTVGPDGHAATLDTAAEPGVNVLTCTG